MPQVLVKSFSLVSWPRQAIKFLILLVLLANVRSLPLVWHVRLFLPAINIRLRYCALKVRHTFKDAKAKTTVLNDWIESLCPIGANPFEMSTTIKGWTSIDDVDFNGHLSNSSYAKTLDFARLESALRAFPAFTRSGGWVGLGSTHYHFIREIPVFTSYEIRTNFGAWDGKWVYVVSRFVSFSGKRPIRPKTSPLDAYIHRPSCLTTFQASGDCNSPLPVGRTLEETIVTAAARLHPSDGDNVTLHCVAISRFCFKHGRITIPPSIVLAGEGFSKPSAAVESSGSYSHSHPPPHWGQVQRLRLAPYGSIETYRDFLKGRWRDIPEGGRWWDVALAGPIEIQRKANLNLLKSLSEAMEVAQTI
ncbi:hypothetical protein BV22DRAFT_1014595 [Leucogyrophana mollusca]|uniref:Uncharacterized protein n=1 Tax=Leucogyrophana mollusca TaxID=85980 RepID=A0ACB8BE93_9AGAM|nr:hypothetical protein BV22DRAFT_1014595 [Leucogyrophana mollusca]